MNSKRRFTFMFAMFSLTVLMLFFQNCSSGDGLYSGGSVTDSFIVDPPIVFASKTAQCTQVTMEFKTTDTVYICVQNAGIAPVYCHAYSTDASCNRIVISPQEGWTMGAIVGNWVKGFSQANGNGWGVGSFTAYAIHTDDPSAVGQGSFTVTAP